MGTRHLQTVIDKEGKEIVNQYGQWDGYPDGQGLDILNYLRTGNLALYQENLEKIHDITPEESQMVDKAGDKWNVEYPFLSRDCGSRIHKLIEEGKVPFVRKIDRAEANKWCEGLYEIDFQKGTFSSEFHGAKSSFTLDNLPSDEEYLLAMKEEEE